MTAWMVIQAFFIILIPLGIIFLCKKIKLLKFIGTVLLCYILRLILGNLSISVEKSIAGSISKIAIVLAIPFILFNCDILRWFSTSNKTVLSFSGMLKNRFVRSSISQSTVTATLASSFTEPTVQLLKNQSSSIILMNNSKTDIVNLIRVCLLAIFFALASIGLAVLLTGEMSVAFIMLGVTTFGIIFSLFKKVNSTRQSYMIGRYLIYVFSFSLALTIDIKSLLSMPAVMFGAVLIHFAFARVFKIDRDTAIVTFTAGIYGPAFIPPVVSAIKNGCHRELSVRQRYWSVKEMVS